MPPGRPRLPPPAVPPFQVMIIPLVVSSQISGMASLDQQASGKLGLRAVLFYFTTTFMIFERFRICLNVLESHRES